MANLTPAVTDTPTASDTQRVVVPQFFASAPTSVLGMSGGDFIIYGGNKVAVKTVASQTTTSPGGGVVSIVATMVNGDVLTCTSANTVISGFSVDVTGDGIATWVYSQ